MKLNTFYNSVNDVLIINNGTKSIKHKVENNVTMFYDEQDRIVGMNIFQPTGFTAGIVDYSQLPEIAKDAFPHPSSAPFIWGYIKACEKHPKSQKLQICQVDIGESVVQIVCGASNCAVDNYVCVATLGSIMPNGMKIVEATVAGIESHGMMCSRKELGIIIDNENGIVLQKTQKVLGSTVQIGEL